MPQPQNPAAPPQTLALNEMLQQQGLQLKDVDPVSGNPIVFDPQAGKTGTLDLPAMMKAEGIDPTKTRVQFNTPGTALPISPVDAKTRLMEGFSDQATFAKTLKDKGFDEVIVPTTQNNLDGIVVRKGAAYYKVDPGFFEGFSPGEVSKDMLELAPDLAIMSGFGALGGRIGGVPGAAVAMLGGAFGAPAIKKSLGRVAGTYNPESTAQAVSDVAWEGALNLAGMIVAPIAAKAGGVALKQVAAPLVRNMDAGARQMASYVLGKLTRAGSTVVDSILDQPSAATGIIKSTAATVRADLQQEAPKLASEVAQVAAAQGPEAAQELASKAIPQRFGQRLMSSLQEKVYEIGSQFMDNSAKLNQQEYVKAQTKMLASEGAKQFEARSYDALDPVLVKMRDAGLGGLREEMRDSKVGPVGTWIFEATKDAARGANRSFDAADQRLIRRFGNDALRWRELGELNGPEGVKTVQQLYRNLNSYGEDFANASSPELRRIGQDLVNTGKQQIYDALGQFKLAEGSSESLASAYGKINKNFADKSDFVNSLKKDLTPSNVLTFVDKLFKDPGEGGASQLAATQLVNSSDAAGKALYQDLINHVAALKMAPVAPRLGLLPTGTGLSATAIAAGVGGPVAAGMTAATTAAMSSPALVRRALDMAGHGRMATESMVNWSHDLSEATAKALFPYMFHFKDMLVSKAGAAKASALMDANAVGNVVGQTLGGAVKEQALKQQLLKKVQ
jgi:hypothetical protein